MFAPLSAWPLATLIIYSAATGILMALVFKYISNQDALARVLDQSRGNALAIKLFKDDLSGIFVSLFNVLRLMALRIWYSVAPVLVLTIPMILILAQFYLRFEYRALAPNETAIVELQVDPKGWMKFRDTKIQPGSSVIVETPALRDKESNSIYWRIHTDQSGTAQIKWDLDDQLVEKTVVSSLDNYTIQKVNFRRGGSLWLDRVWFVGEPSYSRDSPVARATVHYPKRETPIFGFSIPWWATFFVVSIIVAFCSQPFLKVRF